MWTSRLRGIDRHRATINTMTRMRYCDVNGRIDFDAKGVPGTQKPGLYPWFEVPGMRRRETRIVCGHWSALERFAGFWRVRHRYRLRLGRQADRVATGCG